MPPGRPESPLQWLRLVGNVANLTTPLGILVATIGRAKISAGPRGLLLGEGYRLRFPVAGAFTVGSVLTTSSTWEQMLQANPRLLEHEEGHTWQYLYCLGLPFYPAYTACMLWSLIRTGDRAARNFFERSAGLALGGYLDHPVQPLRVTLRAAFGRLGSRLGLSRS
jgi:hypothetical protein